MEDHSRFIPNVHFELIPIKNLVSNQNYQRNLSTSHIQRASEAFDLYQVNPVKVSRRDNVNYVFNGQHTIEIIAKVSGSRETPVWCMIYDDMDYTTEADVFANQQKFIKPLVPFEIFTANIEAGNDRQLIIKDMVESYGLTISKNRRPNSICAISSLEYIYEKYGFQVLSRTIRLCVAAWEGDPISMTSGMLKGIALLIYTYGDNLHDDLFKEKVGAFSPREISRIAKDRKAGSIGYAEAMLIAYNKKMKNALKWSLLYISKKRQPTNETAGEDDGIQMSMEDIDPEDTDPFPV